MIEDMIRLLRCTADGIAGRIPRLARTVVDGFAVSTVVSPDCGPETAILDDEDTHPVERYADEIAALAGHAKWVEFIRDGGRTITKLGYGELVDAEPVQLVAMDEDKAARLGDA